MEKENLKTPEPASATATPIEPASLDDSASKKTMLIKRIVKNEDGGLDAVISLTPEQSHFLLNFAITFLLGQGMLQFLDVPEDDVIDNDIQDVTVLGEGNVTPDENTPS